MANKKANVSAQGAGNSASDVADKEEQAKLDASAAEGAASPEEDRGELVTQNGFSFYRKA